MTDFSAIEAAEMQELWLGVNPNFSVFADEEEAKQAWERHRAVLMVMFAELGRRPWGWWKFDRPPGLHYDDDHEQSILYEAGVVTGDEKLALEQYWRAEFEAAFHHRDVKMRRKHLRDADIPASLIKAWSDHRRRSTKTIRKLKDPPARDASPSGAEAAGDTAV